MRESLKKSIEDSPGFERYPKGSIVLCNSCTKPIFRLDRGIDLADGAGRAATAFKPLNLTDLADLGQRDDIDQGIRAMVREMTADDRREHVRSLKEMRSGDPMKCPCCGDCFVQVLAVTKHEVLDRAYTIEMLYIPPAGTQKPAEVRGRRLGTTKEWLH